MASAIFEKRKSAAGGRESGERGVENGYIVVETVCAFIPFVLLVSSILSLVNIATVQARIHHALTQTANTLSMYSYTLELLGVANDLTALDGKAVRGAMEAGAMLSDINAVLDGFGSLPAAAGAERAARRAYSWAEEAAGDPREALSVLMNFGVSELRGAVFEQLARPLAGRYLSNGGVTGDAYLRSAGVMNSRTGAEGLNALEFYQPGHLGLGNSVMIDRDGKVKLVVEYEVMYTFGGLPLPFRPTLKITQTVVTKAWLNGSGKGYW